VESHGVINNVRFSPNKPQPGIDHVPTYNYTDWWDTGAEPIWITAVKQVKLIA